MNNFNIVVDASIFAKWFLPDEEEAEFALKIKDDFVYGNISVALPSLVYYEINNLLNSAVIGFRIEKEEAFKVYRDFLKLGFEIYATQELQISTLNCALRYDISSYDASYIALAEYLQIPFFTADGKLLKKVKSKYVFALKDYAKSS